MRLTAQEVNVKPTGHVPQRTWLARAYLWACERLYDEMARIYDAVSWLVSAGQWQRWQSGVWDEVVGERVLELGCGTGVMLVQGLRQGKQMVGLDRSPKMLAVARQRVEARHFSCPLVYSDGRAMPLEEKTFDAVMATFPAAYILEGACLGESKRVLCDRGRLVIGGLWVEAHLGGLERVLPVFYGRPHADTLASILARVAEAGFQPRWIEQQKGRFTVGVLVATHSPPHENRSELEEEP